MTSRGISILFKWFTSQTKILKTIWLIHGFGAKQRSGWHAVLCAFFLTSSSLSLAEMLSETVARGSRAKSNKRPPKSKLRSGNYMPLTTACAKAGTRIRKIQRASESANAFGGLNIRRWEILWKTWSKVMERIIKTILDWVLEKKINNWLWLYCQYAVL